MTDKEAMAMALEALECANSPNGDYENEIAALKERLAQPEQEPIGYLSEGSAERLFAKKQAHEQIKNFRLFAQDVPVYTTHRLRFLPEALKSNSRSATHE